MKLMNEIDAPCSGRIEKILLSDGRGLLRRLPASGRRLSVPRVGRHVHARITVTASGVDGRTGPARRLRVR